MYFTGGTVIFDHGHGVSTLFIYERYKEMQKIKKGGIVGTLGQTGKLQGLIWTLDLAGLM